MNRFSFSRLVRSDSKVALVLKPYIQLSVLFLGLLLLGIKRLVCVFSVEEYLTFLLIFSVCGSCVSIWRVFENVVQ